MSTNSKVVLGVVAVIVGSICFYVFDRSMPVIEDEDCFGDIVEERNYALSESFEDVSKAARQELLSHGGKVTHSDSSSFEGAILDGECVHAEITIARDSRFVSTKVVEANGVLVELDTKPLPGKVGVRLTIWDTNGWHDFQFLKGKPQVR